MKNRELLWVFTIFALSSFFIMLPYNKAEGFVKPGRNEAMQLLPKEDTRKGFRAAESQADYAPNQIIIKFKGKTAEDIKNKIITAQDFIMPKNAIMSITSLPSILKSLIKDDTVCEPVFKGLHRQMRDKHATEEQLNHELFVKLSGRRNLSDKKLENYNLSNIFIFKEIDTSRRFPEEICAILSREPNVEYAEPNYLCEVQMLPNDPFYNSSGSWGQNYDDLWALKSDKLNCAPAWDISQGEGIVVAIVDTGIDYTHPDIANNIWINEGEIPKNGIDDDGNGYIDDYIGYDFNYQDSNPKDGYGHGTHVAGTIAAEGNNFTGVIGVAPKAKVMALKALADDGYGYESSLAESLYFAADNGADIINNSWGSISFLQLIKDAVNYVYSLGCVVVAAAGNDNSNVMISYPASFENVISVAATAENDERCWFSDYGFEVEVSAPGGGSGDAAMDGDNILSLLASDSYFSQNYDDLIVNTNYIRLKGTSMACPHVSGLAALILSHDPNLTNYDVRARIMANADKITDEFGILGAGRINAYKALITDQANPFLKFQDVSLKEIEGDGDQMPERNEKIGMIIRLKNYGAAAANVTVNLAKKSGPVSSIISADANYGSFAENEAKDNSDNPFVFQIYDFDIGLDIPAAFELTISADGFSQTLNFVAYLGTKRIAGGDDRQYANPEISGQKIVYQSRKQDEPYYNYNVYMFDLATNQERQITKGVGYYSCDPDIYGNKIVWKDYRNGVWDIYCYNLETNQEIRVTNGEEDAMSPHIYGDKIVYLRGGGVSGPGGEVYLYDLGSHQETRITNDDIMQWRPAIHGNLLAWEDFSFPSGYPGIYVYDIEKNEGRLILGGYYGYSRPSIFDNKVACCVINPYYGYYDIGVYNLNDSSLAIITSDHCNLNPYMSGDLVVWRKTYNNDIYLFNLLTNEEKPITENFFAQLDPRVSDNRLVWEDLRWINGWSIQFAEIPTQHIMFQIKVPNSSFEFDENNNGLADAWETAWGWHPASGACPLDDKFVGRVPYAGAIDGDYVLRLATTMVDPTGFVFCQSDPIEIKPNIFCVASAYMKYNLQEEEVGRADILNDSQKIIANSLSSQNIYENNGGSASFCVAQYDMNGNIVKEDVLNVTNGGGNWHKHDLVFKTTPLTQTISIRFGVGNGSLQGEVLDVDKVEVIQNQ